MPSFSPDHDEMAERLEAVITPEEVDAFLVGLCNKVGHGIDYPAEYVWLAKIILADELTWVRRKQAATDITDALLRLRGALVDLGVELPPDN